MRSTRLGEVRGRVGRRATSLAGRFPCHHWQCALWPLGLPRPNLPPAPPPPPRTHVPLPNFCLVRRSPLQRPVTSSSAGRLFPVQLLRRSAVTLPSLLHLRTAQKNSDLPPYSHSSSPHLRERQACRQEAVPVEVRQREEGPGGRGSGAQDKGKEDMLFWGMPSVRSAVRSLCGACAVCAACAVHHREGSFARKTKAAAAGRHVRMRRALARHIPQLVHADERTA